MYTYIMGFTYFDSFLIQKRLHCLCQEFDTLYVFLKGLFHKLDDLLVGLLDQGRNQEDQEQWNKQLELQEQQQLQGRPNNII